MFKKNVSVLIDPVAMNIVNRVAQGSVIEGKVAYEGGLIVEGEINGRLSIAGALVVMACGRLTGEISVDGDAYIFGQLGQVRGDTKITINGQPHFTQSCTSCADIVCNEPVVYAGAKMSGGFSTI